MSTRIAAPGPHSLALRDGTLLTVRPLGDGDGPALSAFMAALPAVDRYFMKDDVTDPQVIAAWVEAAGRGNSLSLLAVDGERVVADGVLIRHRGGFRQHHAEVRVSILPDYRARGLGTALVRELAQVAWEADLKFLDFELIVGPQDSAIEAMRSIGAYLVGTLEEFVQDASGAACDVVFLRLPLGQWYTY